MDAETTAAVPADAVGAAYGGGLTLLSLARMKEKLIYGFDALRAALERAEASEGEDGFAPLAEALLWIDILNTAFFKASREEGASDYEARRNADEDGRIIEGLRYARHRLVHDIRVYGLHGAIFHTGDFAREDWNADDFDVGTFEWAWRRLENLDEFPVDDPREKASYQEHLEGKAVLPLLVRAERFLKRWDTGDVP